MKLTSLHAEEQRIIDLKYRSERIGKMTPAQLSAHCKALVLKISVITGWSIPENSEYITILTDQLMKKFADDYQDLNVDEFEYAMRAYGTHIKDWGKGLNLALIDDAICEYKGRRQHLSQMEEQNRQKEPQKEALPAAPEDWSAEWEKIKISVRNGTLRTEFISTCLYDWMLREKMITLSGKERWQVLEDCRSAYALEMKDAINSSSALNPEARRQYDLLVKEGDDWRQDENLWVAVVNYSKRETVRIEALNAIANEENK